MEKPSIGHQISDARKALGITQEELAAECNLHIRTIQRIEANDVVPTPFDSRPRFADLDYPPPTGRGLGLRLLFSVPE